jgi:glyoxylase-like metal-dependent hydrolase (beta-lactamase superfamily II)
MRVEKLTFNPIQENMYVLYDDTKECVIIDPGCYFQNEKDHLNAFIADHRLKPVHLLNTHCHLDHICGNAFVSSNWNLKLETSKLDEYNLELSILAGKNYGMPIEPSPAIEVDLKHGDEIQFGNTSLKVLFTPGHSAGHISFYNADHQILLSGDCLFRQSIGRTDLPGGNYDVLIETIRTKLFSLPPDTKVLSGHGEDTTIGYEIRNNPFLQD